MVPEIEHKGVIEGGTMNLAVMLLKEGWCLVHVEDLITL